MRISLLPALAAAVLLSVSPATAEPEARANPTSVAAATETPGTSGAPDATPGVSPTSAPAENAPLSTPASADAGAPAQQATAAPPSPPPPPKPTLIVDINLTKQLMTVSENGKTVHSWPISSARRGYRTATGTFTPQWMAKMWYSRQYDYSPMPHAIFYHRGTAIHGTMETGRLGRPASHGCVRLAPGNAARLFKLVSKHGKERTRIVVHGTPQYREPEVARRNSRDRRYASPSPYYAYPPRGYWDGPGYNEPYRPRRGRPVAGFGGWFFD